MYVKLAPRPAHFTHLAQYFSDKVEIDTDCYPGVPRGTWLRCTAAMAEKLERRLEAEAMSDDDREYIGEVAGLVRKFSCGEPDPKDTRRIPERTESPPLPTIPPDDVVRGPLVW